jgi:hypothetical protein
MVIKNKRGWLKIFEAVIAIMLILGAVLLIYANQQTTNTNQRYIADWQVEILNRIAENETLRNATINLQEAPINHFIENNTPPNLNFTIKICNLTGPCGLDIYISEDVFSQERIISGLIDNYNPKRIRFFVWFK